MKIRIALYLTLLFSTVGESFAEWKKHEVFSSGFNTTAVALDYNGDGLMDVITSYKKKIVLLAAPDWKEAVIHNAARSIHSEAFDVDGDGDPDWLGSSAGGPPIWLENPGKANELWVSRVIDPDITGIHCLLKADVDKDGKLDVIINNFKKEGLLASSVIWLSTPDDVKSAKKWQRHVFADKDAPGGSHYFGFGDIDGDGWAEISVAAKGGTFENGDWFAYWKNPGAANMTKPWKKTVVGEGFLGATNILPGDVDGDGKVDFVASCGHGTGVFWFRAPDWKVEMIDSEMDSPHSLALVDFDADGDLDAASCGFMSNRLSVYYNDGKGNFKRVDVDEAQQSYDLRAVDMDGDGDLDLLNAGRKTGNVAWYENPHSD